MVFGNDQKKDKGKEEIYVFSQENRKHLLFSVQV